MWSPNDRPKSIEIQSSTAFLLALHAQEVVGLALTADAATWEAASGRKASHHRHMRRKREDIFTIKWRRMPYAIKIKRDDPFNVAGETDDMVWRIAAVGRHFSIAGWREEAGYLLLCFPTWD